MKWCEKKKVTCNMDWCNASTCLLNLPDNHGESSIVGVEVNEDYLPVGERQVQEFKQMLNEVAEKGDAVIREHYTLTKLHDDHIKQITNLKNELTATEDLLHAFEQGTIVSPTLQAKIVDYLTDLSKKPGSKKTIIDKAIKWVKNDFKD